MQETGLYSSYSEQGIVRSFWREIGADRTADLLEGAGSETGREGVNIFMISHQGADTLLLTFIKSIFLVGHCSKCFLHFNSI